jgi:hypothetical protein
MKPAFLAGALSLALCLTAASVAGAQTRSDAGGTVISGGYDVSNATKAPLYCQVTVTSVAANLGNLLLAAGCAPVPSWAMLAFLTPEATAQIAIRYRADGPSPTALAGEPVLGWQTWPIQGLNALSGLSLISSTGANVTVDVEIRG